MMTLSDLARKVQEAEGPSRELDAAIWVALGKIDEGHVRSWCRMEMRADLTREQYIAAWAPRYTSSIDHALALVGERLCGKIGPISLTIAGSGQCTIESNDPCCWSVQAFGNTLALALLSALLQALEENQ